jgi:NADH:ubiquinone oxidoreductase subunit D
VGFFSAPKLKAYGVTGVIARASGVLIDLRSGLGGSSYSAYPTSSFKTFIGKRGDCYDRFICRAKEIIESYRLITQNLTFAVEQLTLISGATRSKFVSMESVIAHFKSSSSGLPSTQGIAISSVEGPKGVVSTLAISSATTSPSRVHVRSPVAHNLHLLNTVTNCYTFADFVATFCSMDVVLGEIDR